MSLLTDLGTWFIVAVLLTLALCGAFVGRRHRGEHWDTTRKEDL